MKAHPIYVREQDPITVHLNMVMTRLAVTHLKETHRGRSIKRLVRTLKKYRSFQLDIGGATVTAAVPIVSKNKSMGTNEPTYKPDSVPRTKARW